MDQSPTQTLTTGPTAEGSGPASDRKPNRPHDLPVQEGPGRRNDRQPRRAPATVGVVGLVLAAAVLSEQARQWLLAHRLLVALVVVAVSTALVTPAVISWLRRRSLPSRAAVFLLVTLPVLTAGAGCFFHWMPPAGQLITLRAVVLVVLVITPALMWWLFLSGQRASLLNEFLANLHRLGLLDCLVEAESRETRAARNTRVSSYLQRFEAVYGRLPDKIHKEVLGGRFHPYSRDETRDQASLATSAVSVSLAVVVLAVGWIIALPPIDSFPVDPTEPRWLLALSPNATPATFAFLGAYFFSIQALFRRYVRADLRSTVYVAMVLRIVLAVIGAWIATALGESARWNDTSLLLLAFVIGVFPTVVWQLARSAATKMFRLGRVLPSLKSRLPLERLDGLTVWHESRLEEEDIENVPNMATADVVDLLVNTRIPANRIIDWIDQAMLLTQLGPDEAMNDREDSARRKLARHGVRTATGLLAAAEHGKGHGSALAGVLTDEAGRDTIPALACAIRTNSNLARVLRWRGLERLA